MPLCSKPHGAKFQMTKFKTFKSSLKSVGKLKPTSLTKKVKSSVTKAMATPMGSSLANINPGSLGSPKVTPGFAKGGLAKKQAKAAKKSVKPVKPKNGIY